MSAVRGVLAFASEFTALQLAGAVIAVLFVAWLSLKFLPPTRRVGDYHNKYVLVTGCDSGLGRDLAIRLDGMGFHVFGACLTQQGKRDLEQTCSKRTVGLLMDVTSHEQIAEAFEQVKSVLHSGTGLWAVYNNAGYMTLAPLEWFPLDDYKRMADVNLWGLVDVTKTFLPLVKMARGRVVNVSSIVGLIANELTAPYSITKYGVEAFSDVLRREMLPWGVRVSIIEPQAFKTPLWDNIATKKYMSLWNGLDPEMKKEYGEKFVEEDVAFLRKFIHDSSTAFYMVVDAAVDAITSRDPKHRYSVGWNAKVVSILGVLPSGWTDAFLWTTLPRPSPLGAKK
ncbi:dehydrogenase/reductase SDR family member 9 [Nematostella vectensis]|uniref:dehydrogenase/reductase SDR family member 9 n=1 Tax=Nematostella vectensis TaxID=45351 RepID=UPI00138FACE0|nr:dehydrogenase/reductase SDR family member 9 [Nematostella vectensis]